MTSKITVDARIMNLIKKLAGDKLEKVTAEAQRLHQEDKKLERAWADALETFKCLPKAEKEEEDV